MPDENDNDPLVTGQADDDEGGYSEDLANQLEDVETQRLSLLSLTKSQIKSVTNVADLVAIVKTIRTHIANNVIPALVGALELLGEEIADTDEVALTAVRDARRNRQLVEHLKEKVEELTGTKIEWPAALPEDDDDLARLARIDFDGALAAYADLALLLESKLPGDPEVAEVMGRLEAKLTGAALEASEASSDDDEDEAT